MSDLSLFSLIQSGLVLATTLVWADVVRNSVKYIYPNNDGKVLQAQFIYAIILTIIVILIFYFLQNTKKQLVKLKDTISSFNQNLSQNFNQKSSPKFSSWSSVLELAK